LAESWTPIKADAGRQRKAYGYHEADRLTSAQTTANGAQAFTHDLTGNRTSHTIDAVTETLIIAPTSNRISGISGYASEERGTRNGKIEIGIILGQCLSRSAPATSLRYMNLDYLGE